MADDEVMEVLSESIGNVCQHVKHAVKSSRCSVRGWSTCGIDVGGGAVQRPGGCAARHIVVEPVVARSGP
jgi:hypothetical protein